MPPVPVRRTTSKAEMRRALFVALYFEHREVKTLAAIYRMAGYAPTANDATAAKEVQRLLAHPWVKQQIEERQRRTLRRADYGAEKCVGRLVEIASARAHEYAELLRSKDPYSVLRAMDPALSGAIEAIQVERYPDGSHKKTSVKFYSAVEANLKLGTMWGLRFQQDKVIALNDPGDGPAEGRLKLAELVGEMGGEGIAAFRKVVEELRAVERRRLEQTVEGESHEVEDDGESESEGDGQAAEEGEGANLDDDA